MSGYNRYEESAEIYFLYAGSMEKAGIDVYKRVKDSVASATNPYEEFEGRLSYISGRGDIIEIAGFCLWRGNITIQFEYIAEKPMTASDRERIIPELVEKYVMPCLNTEKYVMLEGTDRVHILSIAGNMTTDDGVAIERLEKEMPEIFASFLLSARS